ncbi:glycosyltransferase family 2 protein [Seohaeicola zhoushanensis]|uniref:Glycosyltransferase 2-like domain-containing protein n=1 Tax=Seohaeicola zhoushanensis TaxID=1569283 RepID=A0A8J3MAR4_9RHOB|nr:glycosyltransferase family 2 protein [Seohaeicola zhoushanensis]GHF59136.1 hypothetical protein GCM10017056_33300 [Seohaeicola zhoushanensis]
MTRFTIIVPCYNAEATLGETLDSLRAQTLPDWDCLLVDDGSTDSTRAIAEAAARRDNRFRVVANPGKGPSSARNLALSEGRGTDIAFCDADDLWLPAKLAEAAETLERTGAAATFGQIAFFDGTQSRTLSQVPGKPLSVPMLLGENPVCTMSNLVIRREAFQATGGFDSTMVHNEDLEWLIRLVAAGHEVIGTDRLQVRYRTMPTGLSSNLEAMRAGRARALETAARYGFTADPRAEAVHLRYLARRALRVDAPAGEALKFALAGVATSPRGFFGDARRGLLTLAGALAAPICPRPLRHALFAF